MNIIVASANPAKIGSVLDAMTQLFAKRTLKVSGIATDSGVAAQPLTSDETLQGALNRLAAISASQSEADYYVAIEAGIDGNCSLAWIAIAHQGQISTSRSASLPLPPAALKAISQGQELGDIMDQMFQQQNVKQQGGAIAMLTQHVLTRSAVYQHAIILAMIPFINPELFKPA